MKDGRTVLFRIVFVLLIPLSYRCDSNDWEPFYVAVSRAFESDCSKLPTSRCYRFTIVTLNFSFFFFWRCVIYSLCKALHLRNSFEAETANFHHSLSKIVENGPLCWSKFQSSSKMLKHATEMPAIPAWTTFKYE